METRYTVRQAVEMTGVKSYVLRYWEEELELRIHRNELGHRYYTGYDIQLFLNIKELKKRGLRLQAIRELIPKLARTVPGTAENRIKLLEGEDLEQEVSDEIAEEEVLEEGFSESDLAAMVGWDDNLRNPVKEGYIITGNIITSISYNFVKWALAFGKMLGIDISAKTFGIQ